MHLRAALAQAAPLTSMRHSIAMRMIWAVCALAFACTGSQSERCKKVCQQETECAPLQKLENEASPYDLDECVEACVALERDTEARHLVDEHVKCAEESKGDCERLMQCR